MLFRSAISALVAASALFAQGPGGPQQPPAPTGPFAPEKFKNIQALTTVPADQLEAAGAALAEDMLATAPLGLRLTKEGLNLSIDAPSLDAAVALEDRGQILCASAGFFTEGIDAFLHKRAAQYDDG